MHRPLEPRRRSARSPLNPHSQHGSGRGAPARAQRRSGCGARHRRVVRARRASTASTSGWRDRWIGRCATSSPSGRRARRCSSPTASTRCTGRSTRRGPGRPVPSELHADGAGALRRRAHAGRLPGSRIRPTRDSSRPTRGTLPADLDEIGRRYIGALADEVRQVAAHVDRAPAAPSRSACAFSGGIDSGSVFLVLYHAMLRLGLSPARLKAFVLEPRRRARRRPGARVPGRRRPVAVPRGDRRAPRTISTSRRRCA